jgi:peptidylprolyl isomerase
MCWQDGWMRHALAAAALLATPAMAQEAEPPTPASVIAAASAAEWRAIPPADLLVMELAPDAAGKVRQVVIQLLPSPFSQGWIGNIRTLARAGWWDGTSIYRVVDNWVAQWGAGEGEDPATSAKPLPPGIVTVPAVPLGRSIATARWVWRATCRRTPARVLSFMR